MSFVDDMFAPSGLGYGHEPRRDLEMIGGAAGASGASQVEVESLRRKVGQLQLLTRALVTLLETKGLATQEELEVLVQQIDLLDGVEDGKMSEEVWHGAARCGHCQHFLNPARDHCVYCGHAQVRQEDGSYAGEGSAAAGVRLATCGMCGKQVPQQQTYFTEQGQLQCGACHRP